MPAQVVGTTGRVDAVRRQPLASASRPQGLNGIFINYSDRRWFNSGEAVPFDATFKRIGTYGTLPVYSRPESPDTIFVPVSGVRPRLSCRIRRPAYGEILLRLEPHPAIGVRRQPRSNPHSHRRSRGRLLHYFQVGPGSDPDGRQQHAAHL